jgi:hypothetical protein
MPQISVPLLTAEYLAMDTELFALIIRERRRTWSRKVEARAPFWSRSFLPGLFLALLCLHLRASYATAAIVKSMALPLKTFVASPPQSL